MGDDIASQLGIKVERVRLIMIFCAVVLAAFAPGAAGPIAFVALAAPQLVVRLTCSKNIPIVSAALMGACLLLAADLFTQLLPLQAAVPIGLMTGLVGGVYLIWLLTRSRQI
ncbi:iron chelate uptake ABC transporter family permease subunit [Photorhabdus asymbiotica]|uniref:iron chelate uptake ABC transporter family permease subunit n=1 Tax=Photorhabdus asymbiotica TaxID=291112 RepID=UPI003DA6FFB6